MRRALFGGVTIVATAASFAFAACANLDGLEGPPREAGVSTEAAADAPIAEGGGESTVVQITAGDTHACLRTAAGTIHCWGDNTRSALGLPADDDRICENGRRCRHRPTRVPGFTTALEVRAGSDYTCARRTPAAVECWGEVPVIPGAPTGARVAPTLVKGIASTQKIALGMRAACVHLKENAIVCWGDNTTGVIAQKIEPPHLFEPVQVEELGLDAIDVAMGVTGRHACARTKANAVSCWGQNRSGELGHDQTLDVGNNCSTAPCSPRPSVIFESTLVATEVVAGLDFTCVRAADGVRCWGSNATGVLGLEPDAIARPVSVLVPASSGLTGLSAGVSHVCGVRESDGKVLCWGSNARGELGTPVTYPPDGGIPNRPRPEVVLDLPAIAQVAAGNGFTIALARDGTLWGWGVNTDGALGHPPRSQDDLETCGATTPTLCNPRPTRIVFPEP